MQLRQWSTLGQSLKLYRFLEGQIDECQKTIGRELEGWDSLVDLEQKPLPAASKHIKVDGLSPSEVNSIRAHCYRVLGVDLTQVDGINGQFIQVFTAEVGPDLSRFRSASAFASWLNLSPRRDVSGGKVLRGKKDKNGNRLAAAFRMALTTGAAAWLACPGIRPGLYVCAEPALFRSESALGDAFRRLRGRLGAPKAITAMAHKLARIVYHLINARQSFDPAILANQQEEQIKRRQARVRKEAARLGFQLVPTPM